MLEESFSALGVIRKLLTDCWDKAVDLILKQRFMDDLLRDPRTADEVIGLVEPILKIFGLARFRRLKPMPNDPQLKKLFKVGYKGSTDQSSQKQRREERRRWISSGTRPVIPTALSQSHGGHIMPGKACPRNER